MSSRYKKMYRRLGAQAVEGKVTVNQARARLGMAPLQVSAGRPAAAVAKAAKPATVRADNPAAVRLSIAAQVLNAAAAEPRDPGLLENIRPGGGTG